MDLRDLRHVLSEVVTPALYAAQEGRPGTRPRLAKIHRAAQELSSEAWLDFEGRTLLGEILACTEESAGLHALREKDLAAFASLLRARIAQLEAQTKDQPAPALRKDETRAEPPKSPTDATSSDADAPGGPSAAQRADAVVEAGPREEPARKPWILAAALLGFLAIGASALILRAREQDCPQGSYRRQGVCVSPNDPLERYANCIIRNVKSSTLIDKGTLVEMKVDEAKRGAASALEVRNKLEESVESITDRCVVLDVSARCFALATGDLKHPALPPSCVGVAVPPPSTEAALEPAPSPTPARRRHCEVQLSTFNLGKPTCPAQSKSRPATPDEAKQLATRHGSCDAFTVTYCEP